MSKITTLLIVTTRSLIIQREVTPEKGDFSEVKRLDWSNEPEKIDLTLLAEWLIEPLTVLFAPEVAYLLKINLNQDHKSLESDLAAQLQLRIPEDLDQLVWGYRETTHTESTHTYEVFVPVMQWWWPIQNYLQQTKIKPEVLLPLTSSVDLNPQTIATSLEQSAFFMVYPTPTKKVMTHPQVSEPFEESAPELDEAKTSSFQPNAKKSSFNRIVLGFLLSIFLLALVALSLLIWNVSSM